jgi:hypothetical protein
MAASRSDQVSNSDFNEINPASISSAKVLSKFSKVTFFAIVESNSQSNLSLAPSGMDRTVIIAIMLVVILIVVLPVVFS